MTKFHKFTKLEPEMDEYEQDMKFCEEKNIFALKMASENAFKKYGFLL